MVLAAQLKSPTFKGNNKPGLPGEVSAFFIIGYQLHKILEEKLENIGKYEKIKPICHNPEIVNPSAIVVIGLQLCCQKHVMRNSMRTILLFSMHLFLMRI